MAVALIGHRTIDHHQIFFLFLNEKIRAIERHPTVISHNTSPSVSIRQTGEQTGVSGQTGPLRISIKDAVVMGSPVKTEMMFNLRIQFIAILVQS